MPAAYAHYVFGDRVLSLLPEHLQVMIGGDPKCRELYNLGVQGPDFLYFYRIYIPFNPVISVGIQMHHGSAEPFFLRARKLLQKEFDPALYSYLLGFMTHFMLDSTCHPYILDRMKRAAATHHEIESEFDRMLMLEDAKNPFTHNPAAYCDTSLDSCRVIARLFPKLTPQQIREGMRMMKFSRGLLRANWWPKRVILYNAARLFQVQGMMLTEAVRPQCIMSNKELYRLFRKAVPETAALMESYDDLLFTGKPLPERFRRNYETLRKFPPVGKKPAAQAKSE